MPLTIAITLLCTFLILTVYAIGKENGRIERDKEIEKKWNTTHLCTKHTNTPFHDNIP